MKHIVMFSSGAGSWAAARRVADEHGTDDLVLLFTDVKGSSANPHHGEDEDNYRFLHEAAADIGGQLVILNEGRTIWDVFRDNRFLGNARLANCSKFLKQQPARAWLDENCDPAETTVYVGIDWSEIHRMKAVKRNYLPFQVEAPMTQPPWWDKDRMLRELRKRSIEPPRLYGMGMAHANCGGGCVRAGQGQFLQLLKVMPERFAAWEQEEQSLREFLGRDDVAILRDRSRESILRYLGLSEDDMVTLTERVWWPADEDEWNGREGEYDPTVHGEWVVESREVVRTTGEPLPPVAPLPLAALRDRAASNDQQLDMFDIGGCGCFVDDGEAA